MTQITENISREEVGCPCCGKVLYYYPFVKDIQEIREEVDRPFNFSSFYRCDRRNSELPGASKNSKHKLGIACDIKTAGWNSNDLWQFVFGAMKRGLSVIIYSKHIHLDRRTGKKIFKYGGPSQ